MTTYIGRIGRMYPTPCVASLEEQNEQRVVYGGGEGSLSPRRARVYGPGSRTWEASSPSNDFKKNNVVYSLARQQSLYGGSYRVVPCDAVDHNLFHPKATEELWDWAGLSVGTLDSFLGVSPGENLPAMMGRVEVGSTATSPRVPAVLIKRAWAALEVAGSATVTVQIHSNLGTTSNHVHEVQNPAGTLSRTKTTFLPFASTVAFSLKITPSAAHPVHFALPQLAYRDTPYSIGKGCDSAHLTMPSRKVAATWKDGIETMNYRIVEVGE